MFYFPRMYLAVKITNYSAQGSIACARLHITPETMPPCLFTQATTIQLSLNKATDSSLRVPKVNWKAFIFKMLIRLSCSSSVHTFATVKSSDAPPNQSWTHLWAKEMEGHPKSYNELQWEKCLKDLLVHPRRPLKKKKKKKKKKSDKCINHFIQLNLELLNTGTVHSLGW